MKLYFCEQISNSMKRLLVFILLPMLSFGQSQHETINQLFEAKQYVKAEQVAEDLVNENPNDLEAVELLGDAYGHLKKWDNAIVQYKKLVNAKPNNANYHYKYGGVLGMKALSVSKFKAVGIIGDAKKAFLKAAELDPNHINTRWALVELYMQLPGIIGGSKKKALRYSDELYNLSEVDGYLSKGYIYEYDKEFEKAEYNYLKAVEVGGSVTCYQNLIDLYNRFDKKDKVKTYLEEATQRHPNSSFKTEL